MSLKRNDAIASRILEAEKCRQREGLELIPSENYVSAEVLEAMGSIFTNKYSEGYPGKRYYGGQINVDDAERLAITRAQKLFKTKYHVNVQPYSGSPANIAVYVGLLKFGDKIMGLALDQGGHLTHGHKVNFSGLAYKVVHYGVDRKTEVIDYDAVEALAVKEKPKLIIAGFTAYPREIDFKRFAKIAKKIGAIAMADISHIAGLVAAGVHPSPFEAGFDVITTTTHKTLRGPRGAIIFCKEEFAKDIDRAIFPGLQGGPHDHTTLAKAVTFGEDLKPAFKTYAKQIVKNAKTLAKQLQSGGVRLISGGTDNHLILADMEPLGLTGKEAENLLDSINITVNKNTVPYDKRSPFDPSGIRLGTPAITTRGMKEPEMKLIGTAMVAAFKNAAKPAELKKLQKEIIKLAIKFPVPGIN